MIEQWGSGIPRILLEGEKLTLPDLQVEEIGMRVLVTVFLSYHFHIQQSAPEVTEEAPGKSEGSWRL